MVNEEQKGLPGKALPGLDNIDWVQVMNEFRLSRQDILGNPNIARQLAEGLFTDLVRIDTDSISGLFSLHVENNITSEKRRLKAYSIEKPKTAGEEIFVLGNRIESEAIKKSLLEKTDWIGSDGKRHYGYANANAGSTVKLEVDGSRGVYLISVHQQTNRIVGETVEVVRNYFFDSLGRLRGRGIFGVRFTEKQALSMCEGRAVRLEGCISQESAAPFGCFVQFDASTNQVAICHPSWVKEAQKAGLDI